MKLWLPELAVGEESNFKKTLAILEARFGIIVGIFAIGPSGMFAWMTFLAPLMIEVAGFFADRITLIMVIAGLVMAAGDFTGGRKADRFSPVVTTGVLLFLLIIALLVTVWLTQRIHVAKLDIIRTNLLKA